MCTIQAKSRCGVNWCRCLGISTALVHSSTILPRASSCADDLVDLRVHQRLAAGDRHDRRAALLDRADRLLDRHPLLEHDAGCWILPQPAHLRLHANNGSSSTTSGNLSRAAASA